MRIRIQDHPEQTLITLQVRANHLITLPATPLATDRPDVREYDIPGLVMTITTEEPQK